jgi:hypothetical protein
MIRRWKWGAYRFSISAAKVLDVKGINSNVGRDLHVLFWDFDEQPFHLVDANLQIIQADNRLSDIYLAKSGRPGRWVAMCFKTFRFRETLQILASTPGIDLSFLKYGIYRGHWTLRLSPKHGNKITPYKVYKSRFPADVSPYALRSFVAYESLDR